MPYMSVQLRTGRDYSEDIELAPEILRKMGVFLPNSPGNAFQIEVSPFCEDRFLQNIHVQPCDESVFAFSLLRQELHSEDTPRIRKPHGLR